MKSKSVPSTDNPLDEVRLEATYRMQGSTYHPIFSRAEWESEVYLGGTIDTYWCWVGQQITLARQEYASATHRHITVSA